jgi:hypothetical protein
MMLESRGRCSIHCEPIIQDRIIVDNGEVTTVVGQPAMADSLVQGH